MSTWFKKFRSRKAQTKPTNLDQPAVAVQREKPSRVAKETIYFFGFDRLGFPLHSKKEMWVGDRHIEYLSYKDSKRLDEPDGLVFPSGLFESFERKRMADYVDVNCDYDHLLSRYREIENLLHRGKWVCCLLQDITDTVPWGRSTHECSDTDLSKRLLNAYGVARDLFPQGTNAKAQYDEFRNFIKRWGVAKTVLFPSHSPRQVLAIAKRTIVGVEFESKALFLPFHTTKFNESELQDLTREICQSIISYLEKRAVELPDWVKSFEFESEKTIQRAITETHDRLSELERDLSIWQAYKGLLVRSGEQLREAAFTVFSEFFDLRVGDEDTGREDLAVLDENGNIAHLIEVKGTNGGVKREYINQVDSHRERQELGDKVPGILLINDFMNIPDFEERNGKPVVEDHIRHAHRLNVLVVRTIDLLRLIRSLESIEKEDRRKLWEDLCSRGGGLLVEKNGSFGVDDGRRSDK